MNKTDRIKRREYFKEQRRASKLPTWQDLPKDTIGELHSKDGPIESTGVVFLDFSDAQEETAEMTKQMFASTYKTLTQEEFQKVISNMTFGENKL